MEIFCAQYFSFTFRIVLICLRSTFWHDGTKHIVSASISLLLSWWYLKYVVIIQLSLSIHICVFISVALIRHDTWYDEEHTWTLINIDTIDMQHWYSTLNPQIITKLMKCLRQVVVAMEPWRMLFSIMDEKIFGVIKPT